MTAPASYPGSSIAATSYPNSTSFVRLQPVGNHSAVSLTNGSRPTYPMNYGAFPDDMAETYGLPSPQYHLPSQESHLPSVNYNSPEMSRAWAPNSHARQPHQNFPLEAEGPSKYASSSFPIPSAPLSTTSTLALNEQPHFPAMSTLKTSLPHCERINNRVLPALGTKLGPASKDHQNTSILSGEGSSTGLPLSLNHRSGASWNADQNGNDGNQRSVGSSTSSTISTTEDPGSNSSSSPQMSQKPTVFGYRPVQQDRESNYGSTYNSTSTSFTERHGGLDSNGLNELSNDHIIPSQDSPPNQYTYNLGSSMKHPEGTLVNGQSYMRLQEPQNVQSFGTLNDLGHTLTYHSHPQRTSISNARHH